LRLIERVDSPDWGRVTVRKGCDLGFVAQKAEFAVGETVRQHVEGGLVAMRKAVQDFERLAERMSDAQGEELDLV
jgi:ATPase subunit of ABC transporter with duplicated ATPase domains